MISGSQYCNWYWYPINCPAWPATLLSPSVQMSVTNWCPFRHVRFNEKQNVSHVPKMTQQLKANSVYRHKALFPNTFPLLSVPFPRVLFQVSRSISHQSVLYPFIHFFPSPKHSNDGRAFTVFTSFKTNMWHSAVPVETFDGSALHSELSELPAPEHSCTPH